MSQLPYEKYPALPEIYNVGNVLGTIIDNLGYRYYWLTEGLTDTVLEHRISEGRRNIRETLGNSQKMIYQFKDAESECGYSNRTEYPKSRSTTCSRGTGRLFLWCCLSMKKSRCKTAAFLLEPTYSYYE